MTEDEAIDIVLNGCDHPPRIGGWCRECNHEIERLLPQDHYVWRL